VLNSHDLVNEVGYFPRRIVSSNQTAQSHGVTLEWGQAPDRMSLSGTATGWELIPEALGCRLKEWQQMAFQSGSLGEIRT
jgi:hypothetical protein